MCGPRGPPIWGRTSPLVPASHSPTAHQCGPFREAERLPLTSPPAPTVRRALLSQAACRGVPDGPHHRSTRRSLARTGPLTMPGGEPPLESGLCCPDQRASYKSSPPGSHPSARPRAGSALHRRREATCTSSTSAEPSDPRAHLAGFRTRRHCDIAAGRASRLVVRRPPQPSRVAADRDAST